MIRYPKNACALVVAITSYGLGREWDLPGAPVGAQLFIDWLKRQGVEQERIYFHDTASVDDIRLVLKTLKDERKDCDCLLLYWAGHGFETEERQRYVFLRDATEALPKAFNIDDIILFLTNDAPQFTTQLGIFDACALGRWSKQVLKEPIQVSQTLPQSQPDCHFILSAPSGTETAYPDDGKPSLFTQRLLELLDANKMTFGELGEELEKEENHAVYRRDGRSRYWSARGFRCDAWALEKEVCRIGGPLQLEDRKWRAEARRLDATIDLPNDDFRTIVEKISGWPNRELAGKLLVALLLRGGAAAKVEIREEIRRSPLLAKSYTAAAEFVANLGAFESPSYLVKTTYLPNSELGALVVWFYSGTDDEEPQRVFEASEVAPFDDAIDAAIGHMKQYEISSQSVINLIAPLALLLEPSKEILAIERDYPVVFRERDRAEGIGRYRRLQPKFRDNLLAVKSRVALEFKVQWFETTEESKWDTVGFPALRTGTGNDAKVHLEKLLAALVPFAAITRPSIKSVAGADEKWLAGALENEKKFAKIPVRVFECRGKEGSILPYVTIIWDDRELPKGYSQ